MESHDELTRELLAEIHARLVRPESIGNSIGTGVMWILFVLMFIAGTMIWLSKYAG